ncbi:MAG: acyl-CoA desaturase, partial [Steroidobacteraceae bacterium]
MSEQLAITVRRWFDTSGGQSGSDPARADRIDWLRAAPFVALHLACLAVLWVGVSRAALAIAAALYVARMFALTGFYHRYFAHRTFRTSRPTQLVFAV